MDGDRTWFDYPSSQEETCWPLRNAKSCNVIGWYQKNCFYFNEKFQMFTLGPILHTSSFATWRCLTYVIKKNFFKIFGLKSWGQEVKFSLFRTFVTLLNPKQFQSSSKLTKRSDTITLLRKHWKFLEWSLLLLLGEDLVLYQMPVPKTMRYLKSRGKQCLLRWSGFLTNKRIIFK